MRQNLVSMPPLRERWVANVAGCPEPAVQGRILDHELATGESRDEVAAVSRQGCRLADTYGVRIGPGPSDAPILALTAAIDVLAHPDR